MQGEYSDHHVSRPRLNSDDEVDYTFYCKCDTFATAIIDTMYSLAVTCRVSLE